MPIAHPTQVWRGKWPARAKKLGGVCIDRSRGNNAVSRKEIGLQLREPRNVYAEAARRGRHEGADGRYIHHQNMKICNGKIAHARINHVRQLFSKFY